MTDRFLGWTAREVRTGTNAGWQPLTVDWQPENIRNCSLARDAQWIGVGATLAARRVLRIHELPSLRRVRALDDVAVLQHTLSRDGRTIFYTRPSNGPGADLVVDDGSKTATLLRGAIAQRSTPSLFPDAAKLAFEAEGGAIEVLEIASGERTRIGTGLAPAVDPSGACVAFHDFREIHIHDLAAKTTTTLRRHGLLPARTLAPWPLSWSPDGERLAFGTASGLTGKGTKFSTIDVTSGRRVEISDDFLQGVVFMNGGEA